MVADLELACGAARIIAMRAPARPKIAPEAPTVGDPDAIASSEPAAQAATYKEQEWPAAERVLTGHPQNEEHDQVAEQMLGVRVHEAGGDQPPDSPARTSSRSMAPVATTRSIVGEAADPDLTQIHGDAREHQCQRHGRNDLHP